MLETNEIIAFYRDYYGNEVSELAQKYPKEQTTLEVAYSDVFQWDRAVAEDWLDEPDTVRGMFEGALYDYDLPAAVDLTGATVQLVDLDGDNTYYPNELSTDNSGYVAVRGDLSRVTAKDEIPLEAAFECVRCGTMTYIPRGKSGVREPNECQGCERQGPFQIDSQKTDWDDYCKVRLETPPDQSGTANAEHIDGYCIGETVHSGGEHGLISRAGQEAILYGTLERQEKDDTDEALYERVLKVEAVEFPNDNDNVDIEAHKERFTELSKQENAVDLLAESVAPALYQTDAWETAMEWAVAYLFAAPRIELPDGTVYRGDIHGAIISDYGMGKSMFSHGVENLSPKCIRKSATALSSDVGLTAAATKDDFGSGQYTLKPGILVRGNGGHVILDEIDKGPDDLESINDAIEGQQQVNKEAGGLSATYNSRVGLLALGNPQEGKFDQMQPVAPQIGVDSSLLSRFDGIITMEDTADVEVDSHIAEQMGEGYAEANQLEYGDLEEDDLDALKSPVDADVARAWVKYARDNCHPIFEKELVEDIRDWYAEEVRQLNNSFAEEGDGEDMPVPATARVVMWTIRFSTAFARCHLREKVLERDVDRAMKLAKRLVSQNWDGEKFDAGQVESNTVSKSQQQRRDEIVETLEGNTLTVSEVADEVRQKYDVVREDLKKLVEHGKVDKLPNGRYEA